MAEPRESTDQENAPLLTGAHDDDDDGDLPRRKAFLGIYDPSRPLTALERVLAVVALLLLLIAGTFIGLFAGTEVALKKERKHHGGGVDAPTVTTTTTDIATTTVMAPGPGPTGAPQKGVCTTPDCVMLSASILKAMNSSADPCDDFYEFAVGGWRDSTTIPADRGLVGSFTEVNDNNKRIILKIIEAIPDAKEASAFDAESDNLQKLKQMYGSCIDVKALNEIALKPFLPLSKFVTDSFAEYNVNPMPGDDASLVGGDEVDWTGAYDEDYVIPERLRMAADRAEYYRDVKNSGIPHKVLTTEETFITESLVKAPEIAKERVDKITKTLAFLHARGVDALVNFVIEGDAGGEDSQIQSLWVYQSFGGLPSKEYYEEAPVLDFYQSVVAGILQDIAEGSEKETSKRDIVADVAQELAADVADGWPWPWPGDDKPDPGQSLEERMKKLAGQVVQFERKVVKAGADLEYLFNPHFAYNPYSSDDVNAAIGFLDLPAYLSTFAPRQYPKNITVTHPPYLKSITKLVADVPDHVLSAYFVTKLALAYAPALGPEVGVRAEKRRLEELLQGIKKGTEENRQDVCLRWVDNVVGYIVGREFVHAAFSPEAKTDGENIINSIVSAFHAKLPHIPWMDAESAAAAQKKAEAIIPKVGYPLYPDTTKAESIKAWYSRLKISEDDFFGNILRAELMDNSRVWLTLGRQRNRDSWEMLPQTVNAYYSPPDGEIVFPAGILQPPFYSLNWPAYLRYGAFGAVAAHELTHAFDNSGAQYDEKGRLRDWWTNKTVEAFQERAQCVARQYSKYYVFDAEGKKVYVNGNLTNGEDIADSGLAQAFAAWQALPRDDTPFKLPGLDFTPEQLFFLAFARVWSQIARPAVAVARVRTDPHSPPYWRATGTLRNLPAFHKAFGCKSGTGMNPPKKDQCELW